MSRKIIFAALTLFLIFSLCGCSGKITSGEVVEKWYTPAHTETRLVPLTIYNGKTSTIIMIPYVYHYNDTWNIKIQAWDESEKEMQTAIYRVPEEVYNAVSVGGQFEYKKDMEPSEPEYTRNKAE